MPKKDSWLKRTARRWWYNEPIYSWEKDPNVKPSFGEYELVGKLSKIAQDISKGIDILHDRVSAFLSSIESTKNKYQMEDFGMVDIIKELKKRLEDTKEQLRPFTELELKTLFNKNNQSSATPLQTPSPSQSQSTQSTPKQPEKPFNKEANTE